MGLRAGSVDRPVQGPGTDDRVQGAALEPGADPDAGAIIAFGPFRLHAAQRRLEKDGASILLPARAFDILVALVEHAGTTVSKNELMTKVWPGVAADESNLRVHVATLRKALGGRETGVKYLSTVSGQGYCFVAQVSRPNDPKQPASRLAPEQGHNLPTRPLHMVGRDQTIDEISEKLASRRFVTIVGPGGIGKTTVAVSTGHALLTEFAGKVHFVDLGTIRDAALVPNVMASTLGLAVGSQDPSDGLAAFLRDKRMLLILDCCEAVIETSAALAERLYKEAPQLHILTTSRESLRVEGEHIHRLRPLESPPDQAGLTAASALTFPAVELFVERATANGGQFELNDANAYDVSVICRRLDGIALAIELAASRVSAYGIKHTIELLNSQFNLLWEGRRTALPRHRALRATIDWSFNLLSDQERAILCRLSVFSGNFTLDAARSVAKSADADDAAITAILASLVAKSMLALGTGHSSSRYRLLDTTRIYAQEKLAASSDADVTARQHASYFQSLLEAIGDSASEHLSEITDQLGDIRGALTWCFSERGDRAIGVALAASSMPLFFELSLLTECQLWATRAIESLDETNGNARHDLALHAALGSARMLTGQIDDRAAACFARALGLAEKIGDVPSQLRLIDRLHLLQTFAGRLDDALSTAKRGEAIAADKENFIALARMRLCLGISCHYVGDLAASRSYVEAALLQSQEMGADVYSRLNFDYPKRAEITLARVLWLQGYPDQAVEMARNALAEVVAINQPVKLCRALLWAFAVFYWNLEAENYEEYIDRLLLEARKYALDSLQIFGEAMKGIVLMARGETQAGLITLKDSVEKMHSRRFGLVAGFSIPLSGALARTGQSVEALAIVDRAIAQARHHNYMMEMPDLLRVKGEALISAKDPDFEQAEHSLKQSLDLARRQGALGYELRTSVSLARLWLQQGHREEARGVLAPVYARFTEGFNGRPLTVARELLDELNSAHPA
jgi:predicted ATPase/DNA-binding winged helix-turn-helix (wHTH) protein